ncbi:hypothetical protein [Photorhabdus luminescens]|uniref:hypothetical protein n=1 Tax=Photorhabdus luminescens TaxID=29488 RepID=UPI001863C60C|nr:hypothetical protein [Photorhabdus luminescens]
MHSGFSVISVQFRNGLMVTPGLMISFYVFNLNTPEQALTNSTVADERLVNWEAV